MNKEVGIGSFRFSSLKGAFVCVLWSGRSRSVCVWGVLEMMISLVSLAFLETWWWVWAHPLAPAGWECGLLSLSLFSHFCVKELSLPTMREKKTREIKTVGNYMIRNLRVQKTHLSGVYWCNSPCKWTRLSETSCFSVQASTDRCIICWLQEPDGLHDLRFHSSWMRLCFGSSCPCMTLEEDRK